jgi:hypothetical protein
MRTVTSFALLFFIKEPLGAFVSLALLIGGILLATGMVDAPFNNARQLVLNAEGTEKTTWALSKARHMPGLTVTRMAIRQTPKTATTGIHNWLHFDPKSGEAQWVLPHNRFRFVEEHLLSRDVKIMGILYVINKDKPVANESGYVIALTAANGQGYTEILSNIEEVIDTTMIAPHVVRITYQEGTFIKNTDIDLLTYAELSTEIVSPPRHPYS